MNLLCRHIFVPLLAAAAAVSGFAQAPRQPANQSAAGQTRPVADPAFQKFLRMSPEERQNALAQLPPARQRQILQRLQLYEAMPSTDRERVNTQLEMLRSLPPQRQNQVRRSLLQMQTLPEDRKTVIRAELARLNALPDEERRARMNSEEFRNIYTPTEQAMMANIAQVLPPKD